MSSALVTLNSINQCWSGSQYSIGECLWEYCISKPPQLNLLSWQELLACRNCIHWLFYFLSPFLVWVSDTRHTNTSVYVCACRGLRLTEIILKFLYQLIERGSPYGYAGCHVFLVLMWSLVPHWAMSASLIHFWKSLSRDILPLSTWNYLLVYYSWFFFLKF